MSVIKYQEETMKSFFKTVAVFLLLLVIFSACQKKADNGALKPLDTSREVELVLYIIGVEKPKQAELFANFNRIAKERLNCTLKINYIGWAEWPTKYPLIFSSGESFDMAYTATWLNFAALAQRGAFMELDTLWPTYAPQNHARQSKTALHQATVNGHLYCIPTLDATYSAHGPIHRADLATPYGWDGKMDTFADMERFLEIVHANNPGIEPFQVYSSGSEADDLFIFNNGIFQTTGTTNDFLFFDPTEVNPKLFTWWEYSKTPEFLAMMARWNEKGFIYKSGLSDTDSEKFRNGKSALYIHGIYSYEEQYRDHPQWDVRWNSFVSDVSNNPFTQDAVVIPTTAKNPERALALYELITNDETAFRAFFYGIEGLNYETVNQNGQTQIRVLNSDDYEFSTFWTARTREFVLPIAGDPTDAQAHKAAFDAYIKDGEKSQKFRSFVIDTTSIETDYAACISVHQQYWWPLELGYVDAASGLKEYQEKMTVAGIERVRTAIQAQLDTYLKELGQ
jgi:putative aldouronate transport system substrate-binding protein